MPFREGAPDASAKGLATSISVTTVLAESPDTRGVGPGFLAATTGTVAHLESADAVSSRAIREQSPTSPTLGANLLGSPGTTSYYGPPARVDGGTEGVPAVRTHPHAVVPDAMKKTILLSTQPKHLRKIFAHHQKHGGDVSDWVSFSQRNSGRTSVVG